MSNGVYSGYSQLYDGFLAKMGSGGTITRRLFVDSMADDIIKSNFTDEQLKGKYEEIRRIKGLAIATASREKCLMHLNELKYIVGKI
jgi:hypothetical protein